jgi:hypothetical protein
MRKHLKLLLALISVFGASTTPVRADTEEACAVFSQATAHVNNDLSPFLELTRKEGWTYDDPGMSGAIQKASSGLNTASRDVEAKLAETEAGPVQNALRHYEDAARELGQKVSANAPSSDLTATIDAYNAAVHTANGACGLGIGG